MLLEGKIVATIDLWSQEQLVPAGETDWHAPQFLVIAEAVVEALASEDISIVELRMTLPTASAEQLLLGMVDGETNITLRELSPSAGPNDPLNLENTGPQPDSSGPAKAESSAQVRSDNSNKKKREIYV